jgi:hypothetical protein
MAANHPQMSTALKNIADLNAVYLQHQRESLKAAEDETRREEKARSSKKSSKKSRKKDSKRKDKKSRKDKKEKKGKKEKKEKKEKKSRKTREASSSSSDSSDASSSESDLDSASEDNRTSRRGGGRAAQRDELERGRTAAECARQILAKFPDVRGDLRGLLRTVDDGEAVAVDGIPDERLKALIAHLFRSLGLHESSKTGAYLLPKDATSTSVRLAMIFDMTPAQLAPFERARSPWRTPEPRPEPAETTKTFAKTDRDDDDGNLEGRAMTGEQADALLGSEEDISSGDEDAGKRGGQGARRKGPPPGASDDAGVTDPLGVETAEREPEVVRRREHRPVAPSQPLRPSRPAPTRARASACSGRWSRPRRCSTPPRWKRRDGRLNPSGPLRRKSSRRLSSPGWTRRSPPRTRPSPRTRTRPRMRTTSSAYPPRRRRHPC